MCMHAQYSQNCLLAMMMEFRRRNLSSEQHDTMLELLIAPIAAAGALDQEGSWGTALLLAIQADGDLKGIELVNRLLDAGAKHDIIKGMTYLSFAIHQHKFAATKILIPLASAAGAIDIFSVRAVCGWVIMFVFLILPLTCSYPSLSFNRSARRK
jgi:hypothetical protein